MPQALYGAAVLVTRLVELVIGGIECRWVGEELRDFLAQVVAAADLFSSEDPFVAVRIAFGRAGVAPLDPQPARPEIEFTAKRSGDGVGVFAP